VNVREDDIGHNIVVVKVEDFLNLIDALKDFLVDFFDVVNLKDKLAFVTAKSEE